MSDVHVRNKDGLFAKCRLMKNGTWKCGFCMRGRINPVKGYQCKVCKCRVSQVFDTAFEMARLRNENEAQQLRVERLLTALRAWKSAEKYSETYGHLTDPEAVQNCTDAWHDAVQLRNAALSDTGDNNDPKA